MKGGARLNNGRVLGRDGAFRGAAPSRTSDEIQGNDIWIGYSGFDDDTASDIVSINVIILKKSFAMRIRTD